MKVNLVGVQAVDFTDDNGKEIKGIKLHYTNPDEMVIGRQASQKFIQHNVCNALGIVADDLADLCESGECEIDIEFNSKGKVVGVAV